MDREEIALHIRDGAEVFEVLLGALDITPSDDGTVVDVELREDAAETLRLAARHCAEYGKAVIVLRGVSSD